MEKFTTCGFDIKAAKEDDRIIEFIATSEIRDRDHDLIKIKGINTKNYKNNAVVLWGHSSRELPIGKTVKLTKSKDVLKAKIQFAKADENPFADQVYRLVKAGYINSVSIGFMPDYKQLEYDEKTNTRIYNKIDLYEISVVNVPANPMATVLSKAIDEGVLTKDEVNIINSKLKTPEGLIEQLNEHIKSLEAKIEKIDNELTALNNPDNYFEYILKDLKPAGGTTSLDTDASRLEDLLDEYM